MNIQFTFLDSFFMLLSLKYYQINNSDIIREYSPLSTLMCIQIHVWITFLGILVYACHVKFVPVRRLNEERVHIRKFCPLASNYLCTLADFNTRFSGHL